MKVLMLANSLSRFPTLSLPCAKDIRVVLPASKKLLGLKCLFSVRQPTGCLISWKACLLSLSLLGLSMVCSGHRMFKEAFLQFHELSFCFRSC